MKRPPKRPAGALTWPAAVKVAKQKGTVYKVKKTAIYFMPYYWTIGNLEIKATSSTTTCTPWLIS